MERMATEEEIAEQVAELRRKKLKTSHLTGVKKGGNYNPTGEALAKPGSVDSGSVYETLRRAWEEKEQPGEPIGVKEARKLLRRNFEKFMVMFLKARDQEGIKPPQPTEVATVATGEKSQSITNLIDDLIKEFENGELQGKP